MDAPTALSAGLVAGAAIAMQFGAVSALLLETAITAGTRAGLAAGLGVASVDGVYAGGAVVVGGAARAALASHRPELMAMAAVILGLVATHGLRAALRGTAGTPTPQTRGGGGLARSYGSAPAQYARFAALTAINPLTIIYFASVAASLSMKGFAARLAFVAGAGAASAAWHLLLSIGAGRAGRRFTPAAMRAVSIAGRLLVAVAAVRLAIGI